MIEHLPQLLLAWSIQLMGVISPGPSVVLILSVATSQGRLPSVITSFGVACASIVLSTTTVLGITVIFAQMADLMTAVRLAGAGYLLWLACKAFRNMAAPPDLSFDQGPQYSPWRAGLIGFGLQLSNPKAIFFWLAIASVGGVGDAPFSVIVRLRRRRVRDFLCRSWRVRPGAFLRPRAQALLPLQEVGRGHARLFFPVRKLQAGDGKGVDGMLRGLIAERQAMQRYHRVDGSSCLNLRTRS